MVWYTSTKILHVTNANRLPSFSLSMITGRNSCAVWLLGSNSSTVWVWVWGGVKTEWEDHTQCTHASCRAVVRLHTLPSLHSSWTARENRFNRFLLHNVQFSGYQPTCDSSSRGAELPSGVRVFRSISTPAFLSTDAGLGGGLSLEQLSTSSTLGTLTLRGTPISVVVLSGGSGLPTTGAVVSSSLTSVMYTDDPTVDVRDGRTY